MKIIFFKYHTGFCGMDGYDLIEYPDYATEEQIAHDAWQGALENAASHGIYPMPYDADTDSFSEESGGDSYSDNIEGSWYHYDPEKHDRFLH